ncbi:hypothetical protein KR084_004227, partial [Drosophila pseudotakahashii]
HKMNKEVHFFFKFEKSVNKSTCNICGAKLAGNHLTNLRRHLITKHKDAFDALKDNNIKTTIAKKRKISYETSEESITSSLVEMVTTDGRPLILLDSNGFRGIMSPIYNALHMTPITSRNIMDHVRAKEIAIKNEIKSLVKRKLLLSLKIDVATRMDKAILGINMQMIKSSIIKKEIIVRTLGMVQLFSSHTGMYIKNKIVDILDEYGISINQIFR